MAHCPDSNPLGAALGDFAADAAGAGFKKGSLVPGGLITLFSAFRLALRSANIRGTDTNRLNAHEAIATLADATGVVVLAGLFSGVASFCVENQHWLRRDLVRRCCALVTPVGAQPI